MQDEFEQARQVLMDVGYKGEKINSVHYEFQRESTIDNAYIRKCEMMKYADKRLIEKAYDEARFVCLHSTSNGGFFVTKCPLSFDDSGGYCKYSSNCLNRVGNPVIVPAKKNLVHGIMGT